MNLKLIIKSKWKNKRINLKNNLLKMKMKFNN